MIQARRYYGVSTDADLVIARPRYLEDTRAPLDPNSVLTRYLPAWKFADLIGSQTLFFAKLKLLRDQDPDEGQIATEETVFDALQDDPERKDAVQGRLYADFIKLGPHQQAFILCFYQGAVESPCMWHEYVANGCGVAIQTTLGKLLAQFNGTSPQDNAKIARVFPIVYTNDKVSAADLRNQNDPIGALKYKGEKWQHENELRAVMYYDVYYLHDKMPTLGERLSVPLWELIDRVILAPHAPAGWEDEVNSLIAETSLRGRLTRSALSAEEVIQCSLCANSESKA